MYYTFPDYYNEFTCSADMCPDTCCAGWDIVVDNRSLDRYRKVRGRYAFKLAKSVNWRKKTFRKSKDGRCAFLRDDGLCDMYKNLGPEQLCRTCRNYPRHIESYENIREVTLSISCPAVAQILMNREEKACFVSREDQITEEDRPGFDPFMYSELSECREQLYCILQNREMPLETRAALCCAVCNDIQVKISRGELFDCRQVWEKYQKDNAISFMQGETEAFLKDEEKYFRIMRGAFLGLYEFETLYEDWPENIFRTEMFLYADGVSSYMDKVRDFYEWKAADKMWNIRMEQILVYFISAYFCRAVYDADVVSKIHMAMIPAAIIHELALAFWARNRKELADSDIVRIVYRVSREIEHSDVNLEKLAALRFEN